MQSFGIEEFSLLGFLVCLVVFLALLLILLRRRTERIDFSSWRPLIGLAPLGTVLLWLWPEEEKLRGIPKKQP